MMNGEKKYECWDENCRETVWHHGRDIATRRWTGWRMKNGDSGKKSKREKEGTKLEVWDMWEIWYWKLWEMLMEITGEILQGEKRYPNNNFQKLAHNCYIRRLFLVVPMFLTNSSHFLVQCGLIKIIFWNKKRNYHSESKFIRFFILCFQSFSVIHYF